MIYLYSGTPGSGKSLHTASVMANWLRSGKPCISNFEFRDDLVREKYKKCGNYLFCDNADMTPEFLIRCSKWHFRTHPEQAKKPEDRILLVIDEAQLVFNCREWDGAGRKEWMSFFTQHRKLGYRVILIAQFDRMLDRQIRSLLEYEYKHRKVSNFGLQGKLLSLWCGGNMYVMVKVWYPLKEKIGSETFVGRPGIYRLYNTYKEFDGGIPGSVTSKTQSKQKNA